MDECILGTAGKQMNNKIGSQLYNLCLCDTPVNLRSWPCYHAFIQMHRIFLQWLFLQKLDDLWLLVALPKLLATACLDLALRNPKSSA
jgi:hypothetical protein